MKIRKKILGYLAIIGLGFCIFSPSMGNIAHAQEETVQNKEKEKEKEKDLNEYRSNLWDFMDLGLKIIYTLLWPMLFLAGIAMDNSMVYGSVFHMDAPLWFFWNMTKNFANFILGFIVLFSILKGIFSSFGGDKGSEDRKPMSIIKNALIAGVLIQASWFLTAALIDVSTIATYAIGGMPTSLLIKDKNKDDGFKILPTHSELNFDIKTKSDGKEMRNWYKIKIKDEDKESINVSPCFVKTFGTSTYIIGRKYGEEMFNHTKKNYLTDVKNTGEDEFSLRNICIYNNTVYFFNEFPNTIREEKKNTELNNGINYETALLNNVNLGSGDAKKFEKCGFFINILEGKGKLDCKLEDLKTVLSGVFENITINNSEKLGIDPREGNASWIKTTATPTMATIIEKSKGFMGPLATIYISIMDIPNLSNTSENSSVAKNLGEMLIRLGIGLGMIFPLIALALILFVRIGFLWVVIAASPLLVLANVFKKTIKIDKLLDSFSILNIIKAVFAPVIIVFALSISIVFMTTLTNSFSTEGKTIEVFDEFGIEKINESDPEFSHISVFGYTIAYPKGVDTYAGITGDLFSWLIISFCGIGAMRFLLFIAIDASGTIGKIGKKVQEFGGNMLKTAPIIPIGEGVGVGTLKEQLFDGNFAQQVRDNKVVKLPEQQKAMNEYTETRMPLLKGSEFGRDSTFNGEETTIMTSALTNGNSDKIISELTQRGFINKDAKDKQKELVDLYTRSGDFREMAGSGMKRELQKELFGQDNFIETQNIAAQEKVKEEIKKEIKKNKTKEDLEKTIKEINKSKERENLKEGDLIEKVTINEITYEIKKDESGLTVTEKKANP